MSELATGCSYWDYTLEKLTYRGTRACKLSLEVLSLALQIVCDSVGPALSFTEVASLQHSSHLWLKTVASKVRKKMQQLSRRQPDGEHAPGQQCRIAQAYCLLVLPESQQRWCLYSLSWFRLI